MNLASMTYNNHYLSNGFAPALIEETEFELTVVGEIPAELEGRFLRIGPNPVAPVDDTNYNWFNGAGMAHGVRIRGGKAEWYRSRWVRGERTNSAIGEPPLPGPILNGRAFEPNTGILGFSGKTWSMVEAGFFPVELDYELNSIARSDFDGTLKSGWTAHPKIIDGEMHGLVYSPLDSYSVLQYVIVGSDARVRRRIDIPVGGATVVHDVAITSKYVVIMDLPLLLNMTRLLPDSFPYTWSPDYGARIGLLPREGTAEDIIWCDAPLKFVFHPLNAYDDADGNVVLDVCDYETVFNKDLCGPAFDHLPTLSRWIVNPATRRVTATMIDDQPQEYPQINPAYYGKLHRYGYTAGQREGFVPGNLLKHDLSSGAVVSHDFGVQQGVSEPIFVAREGGIDEDDGWLMMFVYDHGGGSTKFVILDARSPDEEPVATVDLRHRVPYGFHGNWVPDTAVPPGDAI